ncbi:hypothetical protein [Arthrobacter sp. zg-Y1110]|uniref:hypothetical protein n=1 Tax=Arthrobacter sp. zg-Y1110 TaxID=2886932 RepID=UPI001D139113|nr:hypothetical protein [Arthrobacter sp. zg-Y1110]MCC3292364.1 hypothetical protein [Arthrobacter sp. zg-Y1110]UWX86733.1 hypothetical protein N2K99_17985 [Arthrobacter sp. zg-Y1110]
MSQNRNGNVVLEPLPRHALTADEAKTHLEHLAECVSTKQFSTTATVTVRCFRNDLMTREYAEALYRLITTEYGVPKIRLVDPTPDAAAYFFDLCADNPDSVDVLSGDGAGRTRQTRFRNIGEYVGSE